MEGFSHGKLADRLHSIGKQGKANTVAVAGFGGSGEGGVLKGIEKTLRMGHQPQHASGLITDASHICLRPVGIARRAGSIRSIPQHKLARRLKPGKRCWRTSTEAAFGMGHRQLEPAKSFQKHALRRTHHQLHPAVDEASRPVGRKSGQRAGRGLMQQQGGLQEHLKAIADAEDQAAAVAKAFQRIGEERAQLQGEDPAAGNIVAIRKPARNAEDLILLQQGWFGGQRCDMHPSGDRSGPLECKRCLVVTVGAWGPEDQGSWGKHGNSRWCGSSRQVREEGSGQSKQGRGAEPRASRIPGFARPARRSLGERPPVAGHRSQRS